MGPSKTLLPTLSGIHCFSVGYTHWQCRILWRTNNNHSKRVLSVLTARWMIQRWMAEQYQFCSKPQNVMKKYCHTLRDILWCAANLIFLCHLFLSRLVARLYREVSFATVVGWLMTGKGLNGAGQWTVETGEREGQDQAMQHLEYGFEETWDF